MNSISGYIVMPMLLALGACGNNANKQPDNGVVNVAADDAAMEAAKTRGRTSLAGFDARMAQGGAAVDYQIKFDLDPGVDAEFIWGSVQRRNGDGYVAALANDPELKGFKIGQVVEVARADVIDWGYMKDGVMRGHHTTRALLATLPEAEAAQYRSALGW